MTISAKRFQTLLLKWFDQHGRKHLPWQQNKTPYRVWVSETMLQQTQVSTVIPYFERFLDHFPSIEDLARAHEDEVLHLWAGLGYYSRARNLHKAAKMVVNDLAGHFPDTLDTLQILPGIGPSTAGAILAIAYNKSAAILDGNVKRVLTRLHGISEPINEKKIENKLWDIAVDFTPKERIADYTQAIMDLGATLCVRGQPQCTNCPFKRFCVGHAEGIAAALPKKKASKQIPTKTGTFLIIRHQNRIFLQKRPATGIWGGLWCLPELSGAPDKKSINAFCQRHFKSGEVKLTELTSFKHTFSHYHLMIHPILIELTRTPLRVMEDEQTIWYNLAQPTALGLPRPIQTILREQIL
jgi:A/G-specific adenine glycosylase